MTFTPFGCISHCGLVTRAQADSAGLGGNIAALTMQRGLVWAPQLGITSCRPASKAHFIPGLLYQLSCSLYFTPTLLACSTTASAQQHPALSCLASPVKTTTSAKRVLRELLLSTHPAGHSHVVLPSSASSSISCAFFSPQQSPSQQRSTEPVFGDSPSRDTAFTAMLSPGPTLPQQPTSLSSQGAVPPLCRSGPPRCQGFPFSNFSLLNLLCLQRFTEVL